jgi:hypothetical protein
VPPGGAAVLNRTEEQVLPGRLDRAESQSHTDLEVGPLPHGWPTLDRAALHGIAGDFVQLYEPHTEADVAALLIQFIVLTGSAIGRGPHRRVESTEHHGNLFAVLVGPTASGRKGSSYNRAREPLTIADPDWVKECISGGLSSGEGLIHRVRDDLVNGKGETVPGIADKRLLVYEPEFARTLRVADREQNILSMVIRQAFDSGDLRTTTKSSPETATGTHISIIGHITIDELLRHLGSAEAASGFGNRFLYFAVRRSKFLAYGGDPAPEQVQALGERLSKVLGHARKLGELEESAQERAVWEVIYRDLENRPPGLLGAITQRASAQVLRLKTLYAALDVSSTIEFEHLEAALAVWKYAEESVTFIFGDSFGDPVTDRIVDALRDAPHGLTRNQIYTETLQGNVNATRIRQVLDCLLRTGRVSIETKAAEGRGRPTQIFHALNPLNTLTDCLGKVRQLRFSAPDSLNTATQMKQPDAGDAKAPTQTNGVNGLNRDDDELPF